MTDAMQILRAATKAGMINETEAGSRIRDLLEATGCRHDDEFGRAFDEFASNKETNHRALAIAFGEIAGSGDTEILAVVARHADRYPVIRTKLRVRSGLAGRSPPRQLPSVSDIRLHAASLRDFHDAMVRVGAPLKTETHTLLSGLADIFRDATQTHDTLYELPHAERSYFIQFVRACLQPYFPATEVTPRALAERWKRQKRHAAAAQPTDETP